MEKKNSAYKWKSFVSDVIRPDEGFVEKLGEHEVIEKNYHINSNGIVIYSTYFAKTGEAFLRAEYRMGNEGYGLPGFCTFVDIVGAAEDVDRIDEALSEYIEERRGDVYTIQMLGKKEIGKKIL